jgi:diguanylate cyclase (GGDEF)-like protein
MDPEIHVLRTDKRLMAYTAAAMYGAASLDALLEGLLPADPPFALAPALAVLAIFTFLLSVGPRLPRAALALLGPLGVVLTAVALATTPGAGDGAVLYTLPTLWTTFFFGRRGAVAIVACVAAAHVLVLISVPAASAFPARFVDVIAGVSIVAIVTLALARRNESLVAKLAAESRTDALTGLLNRRGFEERAALALAHTARAGGSLALVTFDLDYFKRVNDEWGHDVGDRVLARTGMVIASLARETDVAARMGGEEFTVLLPLADAHDAEAFSARVRAALVAPDPGGTPLVRISAGVAACERPFDVQACQRRADSALYEAKRSGRDRTVAFDAPPCASATRSAATPAEPALDAR